MSYRFKLCRHLSYFFKPQKHRVDLIVNNLQKGMVLDMGSADMDEGGDLHRALIESSNNKVIGVDIAQNENIDIKADLNKRLPFKDNLSENIVAGEFIEHLVNPFGFIEECYRVLKPNGRLIITTPNASGLQLLIGHESPHHFYIFSLNNIASLLKKAGFRIKKALCINVHFRRNVLLRMISFLIPRLRPTIFIVAEKNIFLER